MWCGCLRYKKDICTSFHKVSIGTFTGFAFSYFFAEVICFIEFLFLIPVIDNEIDILGGEEGGGAHKVY